MTEQRYLSPLTSFQLPCHPKEWIEVDVLNRGSEAISEIDKELGLAFDQQDMIYYTHLFKDVLKRNPTSVELFDLAQSNSEHSRHWFFRVCDTKGSNRLLFSHNNACLFFYNFFPRVTFRSMGKKLKNRWSKWFKRRRSTATTTMSLNSKIIPVPSEDFPTCHHWFRVIHQKLHSWTWITIWIVTSFSRQRRTTSPLEWRHSRERRQVCFATKNANFWWIQMSWWQESMAWGGS